MKIAEIQALRAFAAFLVLFYHIRETELAHAALTGSKTAPLMNIFDTGFAGVDLFFAVSGFVMVYVTYKIPASLHRTGDFWLARVFRIYPTWWLYCALFSVLCLIMAGTLWIPGSINPATTDPSLFLLKSWFLIPQPDLPQINVGWTLVHEIHFYMVFGLLLLLPRKMLLAALLVWAALLVAIRFAYPALEMRSSYLAIALSPYSLEFIGGAFAGWLVVTGRRRFALPVLLLGLAGFAAGLYLISDAPLPWDRVMIFIVPVTAIVYGAGGLTQGPQYGRIRGAMATLGDWSFSLYLCHPLVLICLGVIFMNAAEVSPSIGVPASVFAIPGNVLFTIAAIAGSLIVAAISYHVFEKTTLSWLNRRFRRRQADKAKSELLETVAP